MNKGIKTAICLLIATAFIIPGASTIGNEPIVDEPKPEPEPLPTLIEAQSCLTDPEGARAPETPPHEPTGFDAINMETGESPPEPSRDEGDIIFEQMPVSPDYPGWSLPFSDLYQGPGYRVYDNFAGLSELIGDVSWWGLEAYGDNDVTGDVFTVAFFLDDGGIPDLGNPQYDFTDMEVGVDITATPYPEDDPWIFVGYTLFYYEMELPEDVDMSDGWFSVYRTTPSTSGSAWAWDQDPAGEGMDDYRYHEFVSPPEEWDDVAFRFFAGAPPIPPGTDLGVKEINSPAGEMSYGQHEVNATIHNYGINPVTTCDAFYNVWEEIPGTTTEIYTDDMENIPSEDWTAIDGNGDGDTWTPSTAMYHSANTSYKCTQYDTYRGDADDYLISKTFDLSGAASAELTFWHWCEGETISGGDGYIYLVDYGFVYLSSDNGATWTPVAYAYDNDWTEVKIEIGDYTALTDQVKIMFRWQSNPAIQYEGWYIDDISVTRTEPITKVLCAQAIEYSYPVNLEPGEEKYLVFTLLFNPPTEDAFYKINVSIVVENDLIPKNNYKEGHFWIGDVDDVGVKSIVVPPEVEVGESATFDATISNYGTLSETAEVTCRVQPLVYQEVFSDDMENGEAWETYAFGGPDLWHKSTKDSHSGSKSWYCGEEGGDIGYYVNDMYVNFLLTANTFDFTGAEEGKLSYYAKWSFQDPYDNWCVMLYDPYTNYILGQTWQTPMGGTYFNNNEWFGPANPQGFDNPVAEDRGVVYTAVDLLYVMQYWREVMGPQSGVPFFGTPENPSYKCGIGFAIWETDETINICPDNPEEWSGLLIDDVKVIAGYPGTAVFTNTTTVDLPYLGEKELSFTWNETALSNYLVTIETSIPSDMDTTNDVMKAQTRISKSIFSDDVEAGEGEWNHIDLTANLLSHWHIVSSDGAGENESDHYYWCGDDATGGYGDNWDDSLTFNASIDLSAYGKAKISFKQYYWIENGFDYGIVEVSDDGGQHWYELTRYTGDSGGWIDGSAVIPTERMSEEVMVRFRFQSDYMVHYNGWYIDDVSIMPLTYGGIEIDHESFEAFPPPGWEVVDYLPSRPPYYGTWGYYEYYKCAWVYYNSQGASNTTLITPDVDLTGATSPVLSFSYYIYDYYGYADYYVDISTDYGDTWTNIITLYDTYYDWLTYEYNLTGYDHLMVRFRYDNPTTSYCYWQLDNVLVGEMEINYGDIYYSEDFNDDDGGYTHGGTNDNWEWGDPSESGYGPDEAHSEPNCWGTNMDGYYENSENAWLESVPIDLTGFQMKPYLTFWHWCDLETNWDGGQVLISTDDGSTWTLIHPEEGYDSDSVYGLSGPGYTGTFDWRMALFDLSDYMGEEVIIRWRFGSDASVNYYDGWYIDDVAIQELEVILHGIYEDFSAPFPPLGWQVIQKDAETWVRGTYDAQIGVNSAECWWSYGEQDEYLVSPVIDFTDGSVGMLLFWSWHHGNDWVPEMTDHKYVRVSVDGGPWQTIADLVTTPTNNFDSPFEFGIPSGMVRFAFNLYWTEAEPQINRGIWLVDNVTLERWTPQPEIFTDDMESGTAQWITMLYPSGDWWHIVDNVNHSGNHSWWCGDDLAGTYPVRLNDVLAMEADLSTAYDAQVAFWQKYGIASGDAGYFEISIDGGDTWTALTTYTGSSDWAEEKIDLNEWIGNEALIRFRFTSNDAGTSTGWFIDDVDVTIKEDTDAPVTECELDPETPDGANGWYVSPVTVTLTATDPTTEVDYTEYNLDGTGWTRYTAQFTVSEDGEHTVQYKSVDICGNVETTKSCSFKIDMTLPTVNITAPKEGYLYLFGHPIIPIGRTIIIGQITIEAEAMDETSGVEKVKFTVTVAGGVVLEQEVTSPPYKCDFTERYLIPKTCTLTADCYDMAGNAATPDSMDFWKWI